MSVTRNLNDIVANLVAKNSHGPDLCLTIITTRQCNLRCKHCNVIEGLCVQEKRSLDYDSIGSFISKFGKRNIVSFITGGEVLLHPDDIPKLTHALRGSGCDHISLGTNLTVMPDKIIEFLVTLQRVQVSIDGFIDDHDANRGAGTFALTYKNVRKLVMAGANVQIVSAMDHDRFSPDSIAKIYRAMHYAGVSMKNVHIGLAGPSCGDTENGIKSIKRTSHLARLYKEPCCAYRPMRNITIDPEGKLYTNYYDAMLRREDSIGTMEDALEDILKRWIELIMTKAHWAKDEECLKCEALEYCWGLHCVGHMVYPTAPKPSSMCNKPKILEHIAKTSNALTV